MSPLARSLLALAVLAVATAQYPPPPPPPGCADEDVGERGITDVPLTTVNVPCPEGTVDVPDDCPGGQYRCGEFIEACNPDPYGPPPTIYVNPITFTPVQITCNDPNESYATVSITLHCCFRGPPLSQTPRHRIR